MVDRFLGPGECLLVIAEARTATRPRTRTARCTDGKCRREARVCATGAQTRFVAAQPEIRRRIDRTRTSSLGRSGLSPRSPGATRLGDRAREIVRAGTRSRHARAGERGSRHRARRMVLRRPEGRAPRFRGVDLASARGSSYAARRSSPRLVDLGVHDATLRGLRTIAGLIAIGELGDAVANHARPARGGRRTVSCQSCGGASPSLRKRDRGPPTAPCMRCARFLSRVGERHARDRDRRSPSAAGCGPPTPPLREPRLRDAPDFATPGARSRWPRALGPERTQNCACG